MQQLVGNVREEDDIFPTVGWKIVQGTGKRGVSPKKRKSKEKRKDEKVGNRGIGLNVGKSDPGRIPKKEGSVGSYGGGRGAKGTRLATQKPSTGT